jgi:hypothetical protein
MNINKSIFLSQHYLAMKIADVFNEQVKSSLLAMKANKTFFPTPASLYDKEVVKERMKQLFVKDENPNSETIKFNSSNAIFDRKSLCDSKSFYSTISRNQQLQSKNPKNHYSANNYLNQNFPVINPISLQANSIFANNNINLNSKNNNKINNNNLFKSGLYPKSSNSLRLANTHISSFAAFFSNVSTNSFSKESSLNNYNSSYNSNCKIYNDNLLKNTNNLSKSNTMHFVNKKNSHISSNNKNSNITNNNNINENFNSSHLNNLFKIKNGGNNSQLSENNFSLNSFKNKNSSLMDKSEFLAANESTYFENNANENSLISNFNSIDSITRKSSYNYDYNNCHNSKNLENLENAKISIFSIRNNSRFFDIENEKENSAKADSLNTTSDSVNVPEFISEFISKKFSKFSFFNKFSKDDEKILYENFLLKEIDENHEWAKFIYSFESLSCQEHSMLKKFNSS